MIVIVPVTAMPYAKASAAELWNVNDERQDGDQQQPS